MGRCRTALAGMAPMSTMRRRCACLLGLYAPQADPRPSPANVLSACAEASSFTSASLLYLPSPPPLAPIILAHVCAGAPGDEGSLASDGGGVEEASGGSGVVTAGVEHAIMTIMRGPCAWLGPCHSCSLCKQRQLRCTAFKTVRLSSFRRAPHAAATLHQLFAFVLAGQNLERHSGSCVYCSCRGTGPRGSRQQVGHIIAKPRSNATGVSSRRHSRLYCLALVW